MGIGMVDLGPISLLPIAEVPCIVDYLAFGVIGLGAIQVQGHADKGLGVGAGLGNGHRVADYDRKAPEAVSCDGGVRQAIVVADREDNIENHGLVIAEIELAFVLCQEYWAGKVELVELPGVIDDEAGPEGMGARAVEGYILTDKDL